MQNLAILTNNSNNQLGEEINLLGQNFNTDEIINKGKDFLKVLNNDNAASQKTQLNNNYQNTNKKDFNKRENTLNKNNVENDKDYTQAVKENIQ